MSDGNGDRLPSGFLFAAGYAGIRKAASDDLALMVSEVPASAAGVFTRNAVRAAPVDKSRDALGRSGGIAQVIVANAGNANCATSNMHRVATSTARAAAALAGVPENRVLLASTGVIGEPVGEQVIPDSLPRLWRSLDRSRFESCARAIMTTDTVPKVRYAEARMEGGTVRLAGMAKGAGMIMPDMATMLAFLFTDAAIDPDLLDRILRSCVRRSFNCVTVDSDTSTNDTVFLLANGACGITVDDSNGVEFVSALDRLTRDLAIDIARDGEGASKLVTIEVAGAASDRDARRIAMAIANSPLVKTAVAGADPNWGRILGAAGKAGVDFDPSLVSVFLNDVQVCAGGIRAPFHEPDVQRAMEGDEVAISLRLGTGEAGRAVVWTCDLTESYIRINADYRT